MTIQQSSPLMAFLMRYRMQVSFLVFTALLAEDILEGLRPHALASLADPAGLIGALMLLAGAFTRSWAAGVIHKEAQLATAGPYSLVRHPLYLGSFLMALGACTILGDVENFVGAGVLVLVIYVPKVRREERALAKKFDGAWQQYVDKTPMIVPHLALPRSAGAWSLEQWLYNREYNALSASFLALALFQLWRML